jgi:hypothetical protein
MSGRDIERTTSWSKPCNLRGRTHALAHPDHAQHLTCATLIILPAILATLQSRDHGRDRQPHRQGKPQGLEIGGQYQKDHTHGHQEPKTETSEQQTL